GGASPTAAGAAARRTGGGHGMSATPATRTGAAAASAMIGGGQANARIGRAAATPNAAMPRCAAPAAGRSPPWSRSSCAAAASRAPSSTTGRSTKSRAGSAATRPSAPRSRRCPTAPKRPRGGPAAPGPADGPHAPRARLGGGERGTAATLAPFDRVEPALTPFTGARDAGQRPRFSRDLAARAAAKGRETTPRRGAQGERRERREYSPRRDRARAYA